MRLVKYLKQIFEPEGLQDISIEQIGMALNDKSVRTFWLISLLDELKRLNLAIDGCLDRKDESKFIELAHRRRTLVWVLSEVLLVQNRLAEDGDHNQGLDGLETVTVNPAPH